MIVEYMIGADFCIPPNDMREYRLSCGINSNEGTPTQSRAFPTPDRAWFLNGDELYQAGANDPPPETRDFPEFFMDPPTRILLAPDSVFPSVLQTRDDGGLQFNLQAENLTLPEAMLPPGVDPDNFRPDILAAIVGDWTCEANNSFGMDTATSTIRICGMYCRECLQQRHGCGLEKKKRWPHLLLCQRGLYGLGEGGILYHLWYI